MKKNLENKSKMVPWQDIKLIAKAAIITSVLMQPVLQNTEGYISTKMAINRTEGLEHKEYRANLEKDLYKNSNFFLKTMSFGDYIAANEYLKNN